MKTTTTIPAMDEYEKQAEEFLEKTNTIMKIEFLRHGKHFQDDKRSRDTYEITLKNEKHIYKFNFGQSLINSGTLSNNFKKQKPTNYDVLSCLNVDCSGDFEYFCREFGYNEDSVKARAIYRSVQGESNNLYKLFDHKEIEQLSEIQ